MLLGELIGKLKTDDSAWDTGLRKAKGSFDAFGKNVEEGSSKASGRMRDSFVGDLATIRMAFNGLGGTMSGFVRSSVLSVTNLPLFAAIIDGVLSTGGAIGTIPAVAGAAGLAVGTLKIALLGFGDAMKDIRDPKKFAEAIKEFPPPMRDTAEAVRELLPLWDSLKKSTQSAFFKELNTEVKQLGGTYLPLLERNTTRVAGQFNVAAHGVSNFLTTGATLGDVSNSMDRMGIFTGAFAAALQPATQILVDLITVGSEFLPGMADGLEAAALQAAYFVRNARETGQLKAWIQEGIDSVVKLTNIVVNFGLIFAGVMRASGADGADFLTTLENLTVRMLEWVNSAEGQEKIGEVFEGLRNVVFALLEILPHVTGFIFAIAEAFTSLPGPVQAVIGQFIGWFGLLAIVAGYITPLVLAVKALGIASLFTAANLTAFWTALTGPVGIAVALIIGAVALIIYHWDTLKEIPGKVLSFFSGFPGMLGDMASSAWGAIEGALSRGWAATKAWVSNIPYNVGYMLGALIGILLKLGLDAWNALTHGISTAWNGTVSFVTSAPGRIYGFMTNLPGMLYNLAVWAWNSLLDGAVNTFQGLVGFVTSIPGRIVGALGNLGSLLWNAGKSIIDGLLAGIKSAYQGMISFVSGIGDGIAANKGPLDYDRRLLIPHGNALMDGLLGGLRKGNTFVQDFVSGIVESMQAKLSNNTLQAQFAGMPFSPQQQTLLDTARNALNNARGLVIENFHPPAAVDERRMAEELDWLARGRG